MDEQNQPASAPDKKSSKKGILVLAGIAVLALVLLAGGYFLFKNFSGNNGNSGNGQKNTSQTSGTPTPPPFTRVNYKCADDKSIEATFYNEDDPKTVSLVTSDGESTSLDQVGSASGAKYASNDDSYVFWSSGNEAYIEQNGQKTYANCIEASITPPAYE